MEKLFYKDIHITDFDAKVIECSYDEKGKNHRLILDRTAFFPEEGGQSADKGTLNGYPVVDVQIKNDIITHIVADAPCSLFALGTPVTGHVDWAQRFDFMQQHSGEHIISGLVHKHYGYDNVGFHLGLQEVTLDFNGVLSLDQLRKIETEANDFVWQNLPIQITWPTPEELVQLEYRSKLDLTENVRIVTIDGVDACACCAPHVASTAQVGIIRIAQSINYKGGMRLWVVCGERALRLWHAEHDALDAIARSFSASRDEALQSVLRLQKESGELRGELAQCRRELLLGRVRQAAAGGERHLLIFDGGSDANAMRYAAEQGASLCSGACAVFSTEQDGTVRYVCIADNTPLRAVSKDLHAKLGGRGGGSDRMIQGSVPYDENAIRAFFAEI
jgi:alanyl-tRNA synthetase